MKRGLGVNIICGIWTFPNNVSDSIICERNMENLCSAFCSLLWDEMEFLNANDTNVRNA